MLATDPPETQQRFTFAGEVPSRNPRWTTEDVRSVDVREIRRRKRIAPGRERLRGVAELEWTPCAFGGVRPWFLCPNCGRRTAILYRPFPLVRRGAGPSTMPYLCRARSCYDLAYPSQQEAPSKAERERRRAWRRALKLRARLKGAARETLPPRPKGMHRATYERLIREYEDAVGEYVALYEERRRDLRTRFDGLKPGSPERKRIQVLWYWMRREIRELLGHGTPLG